MSFVESLAHMAALRPLRTLLPGAATNNGISSPPNERQPDVQLGTAKPG